MNYHCISSRKQQSQQNCPKHYIELKLPRGYLIQGVSPVLLRRKLLRQNREKDRINNAWKGEIVKVIYLKIICVTARQAYPVIAYTYAMLGLVVSKLSRNFILIVLTISEKVKISSITNKLQMCQDICKSQKINIAMPLFIKDNQSSCTIQQVIIFNSDSQMYFGFGPFGGVGFSASNANQQPRQQFFNHPQQPGFVPNNNHFNNQYRPPPPPPQQNNNGGFFSGFTNFINDNFMNPFLNNNQGRQNQRPREEQARPSFFRKSSQQEKQGKKAQSPQKKETYSENTGIYWKIKGNQAFQNGKYELAMQFYTKAIELNNCESVFYSNRAQCFKKLGRIDEALRDAQQAVELDSSNIRGHMISGQILAQTGKLQDNMHKVQNSITRLTKSLTLCGGKKLELQKQISRYIYLAKKVLFYLQFNLVRNTRIRAINQYKEYLANDDKLDADTKQRKMQQFLDASNERVVFSIPEYLQCRITLDLMEDPVITDCGQTYERSAIEQHMQRNGKTDPFTRQPIKGPLYPSISIKKAISDFLDRNPWAYQYSEGQNYKNISF